jgi:PAS domain S-box-containing protein
MLRVMAVRAAAELERRTAEEALRRAKDELEMRVRERTAELTAANRRLEAEIAEHQRTAEALQVSEERYRRLVETMNEGLAVQDEKGVLTYVNDKLCDMVGYGRDEVIGRPAAEFFTAQGRQVYAEQMVRRRSGHEEPYEATLARKDGQEVHTVISPRALLGEDGRMKGSFALVMDITERKRAEEALRESEEQLRRLSYEILTIQETERRRISRELHDQLGQDLTLAKLMLRSVEKALPNDWEAARDECEDLLEFIDQVIENVRRLSRDLSPAILEDVGLSAALQWLTETFAENTGLRVRSDIAHIDHLVSKHAHIMLYRVLQEALTNIAKHAGAQNVHVEIRADDDRVYFSVEDDGEGIESERTGARDGTQQGLGITIMDERVRFLGGALDIESSPGKGTRVSFTMPLEKA